MKNKQYHTDRTIRISSRKNVSGKIAEKDTLDTQIHDHWHKVEYNEVLLG